VDAKIDNIFLQSSLKLLYLESHNGKKRRHVPAELNFSFSQLSLCKSVPTEDYTETLQNQT